MLDYEEHARLNWEDTIALFEKKELNVPAEIAYSIYRNINPTSITMYIDTLCLTVPSASKYKEDIEKYLLLM